MLSSQRPHYALPFILLILAISGIVVLSSTSSSTSKTSLLSTSLAWLADRYNSTTCTTLTPRPLEFGQGTALNIWTKNGTRNATAPYLPGILFEDIAHSGDGGIYAELIRNRAFQGSGARIGASDPLLPGKVITEAENPVIPFAPVLDGWYSVGDARLSLDLLHPLSDALQVTLQVDVPIDATGEVGFKNDGYWGMSVTPQNYNASFYAQTNGFRWNATLTHFNISLRDNATDEVFASTAMPMNKSTMPVPWTHKQYTSQLACATNAPTTSNAFAITMDAAEARGQTFYFTLISLFPAKTYKFRSNGLREDLASGLEAANFAFFRLPGGNNVEGYSIARRWKWWETIGPLKDRPGRVGDWSYFNTDGLGLLEYMYWCEDMGLVPVLSVYAGFSLDVTNWDAGNSTDANELPIEMMGPILQEALDELEFLTSSADTYWGGKRADYGHPEPFEVPFVEIGNEDFFSHNYPARSAFMFQGLKAKYPNITYIYSAGGIWPERAMNITLPNGTIWDEHIYAPPQTFVDNFNQFDNWQAQTNNPSAYASIMEYHAGGGHPTIRAAVAEAVYALGWERNPNTVRLACFAPLIQHRNVWRGTPYLALFDADPARTVWSVSYWQEWLFNQYRGEETAEVSEDVYSEAGGDGRGFGPVYWAASIDTADGNGGGEKVFLKVVNAGNAYEPLTVKVDAALSKEANGTTLHALDPGDEGAYNNVGEEKVVPGRANGLETRRKKGEVMWTIPPWSVTVLQFELAGHGGDLEQEERDADGKRRDIERGIPPLREEQVVLQ